KEHWKSHGVLAPKVELDLPAMLKRKEGVVSTLAQGIDGLFKKNKVTRILGKASFQSPGTLLVEDPNGGVPTKVEAKRVLIATGSKSASLKGVDVDGIRVCTSTEALSFSEVPKHLVVIGAGAIGLELGSVWRRLGSQVTVLEYLDRILPGMDAEIATEAKRTFEKQGLEFQLGTRVIRAAADGSKAVVESEGRPALTCDRVLLATGRVPNTDGLGLASIGVKPDARGRIPVDAHYATTAVGVHAIGDVIAGPMLAHKAEEDGIACVEHMITGFGHVNYESIPAIVYTDPEIASVGRSEEELKAAAVDYRKGTFPFAASGRARAIGKTEGKVKVLADSKTDRVLGVHIIGAHAGDLIAEAAMAMAFKASAEDIARVCHAHPTLAEGIKEAAMAAAFGRPLHL
ncbi:MAG: dihydrolipoyl dehydrogenase, partial [Verrucomicrobia bacterium]|nr:dihydrolipoyl dehydrogenase [Verrucomicrobiota bacterium]